MQKIELLHLRKSWLQFKKSVDDNKMKLKSTPTEWALHRIVRTFSSNEDLTMIYEIAKVALVAHDHYKWPAFKTAEYLMEEVTNIYQSKSH